MAKRFKVTNSLKKVIQKMIKHNADQGLGTYTDERTASAVSIMANREVPVQTIRYQRIKMGITIPRGWQARRVKQETLITDRRSGQIQKAARHIAAALAELFTN